MASLWQSIKNWWRGKTDAAAEAMADPVRDAKFAIEDSEKVCEEFEGKVANLMAQNKRNVYAATSARADEKKWANIAAAAAKSGNRKDCEEAVSNKNEAATKATRLEDEVKRNDATVASLRKTLEETRGRIEHARNNKEVLEARFKGAQVREDLLRASSNLGGGPLAALDDLEKKTIEAETHAEAVVELSGNGDEALEEKYTSGNADVQSEVDRLMSENNG